MSHKVVGFTDLKKTNQTPYVTDFEVTVYYTTFATESGFVEEETRLARLIRESEFGRPEENGDWGVNPISVRTKLEEEKE